MTTIVAANNILRNGNLVSFKCIGKTFSSVGKDGFVWMEGGENKEEDITVNFLENDYTSSQLIVKRHHAARFHEKFLA